MLFANPEIFTAPVRKIVGKVELSLDGSTPITYTHDGSLKSITVERIGESKFFGFGISHKANIKIIDTNRTCAPTTSHFARIYFEDIVAVPKMYVSEVHRDETTNEVSITLYDRLYDTTKHTLNELGLESYTMRGLAQAIANFLGVQLYIPFEFMDDSYVYEGGANFNGTETLREVLDDIAEATQTYYYINASNELVFCGLDRSTDDIAIAFTIDKSQYFSLDTKTNRRLTKIISATELGDNVEVTTGLTGTTQIVWDNAFWTYGETDITEQLNNAIASVGDLTINQFSCEWRGCPWIEPGDKIALVAKDGSIVYSYLINDSYTYDGAFSQKTEWEYTDEEVEHTNPVSLGDALKQTMAKVDKANQEISLVVNTTTEAINSINGDIEQINKKVGLTVDKEAVEIMISDAVGKGANKIETSTGYTFNDEGLTVSKSDSDISTTITEDGMTVKKGREDVLTANNEGVKAIDLHATTYLVIGNNSRFEDYEGNRTACFWIGG